MSFLDVLDRRITALEEELGQVRNARLKKDFYVNYVVQCINDNINNLAEKNSSDPTAVFREVLSNVSTFIGDAFSQADRIEINVATKLQESVETRRAYISYENKLKQDFSNVESEEKPAPEKEEEIKVKNKSRKPGTKPKKERNIGERPEDKLKNRKKKSNPKKA